MAKVYCIGHKDNLDGFASMWVVHHYFSSFKDNINLSLATQGILQRPGDVEYIYTNYGEAVPPLEPESILYIVDFSYPPETLRGLAAAHKKIVVVDCRDSAVAELAAELEKRLLPDNVQFVYMPGHSGCVTTWYTLFFQQGIEAPYFLKLIEDRDLWTFKYEDTKPFCRSLKSLINTFSNFDKVNQCSSVEGGLAAFIETGTCLLGDDMMNVNTIIRETARALPFDGTTDAIVTNAPAWLAAEVNDVLLSTERMAERFVATYYDTEDHRVFRLNSKKGSDIDVLEIAKRYGGGGGKHSAGFKVPRDHKLAML